MTTLLLECSPGDDGGLKQTFYLEVYNTLLKQFQSNLTSNERPSFLLENLSPGTKFNLIVYSANSKGRGPQLTFDAATVGPPERQTSQSSSLSDFGSDLWLIWIAAASALLILVIFAIVIVVRIFTRRNSSGKALLVCHIYHTHNTHMNRKLE